MQIALCNQHNTICIIHIQLYLSNFILSPHTPPYPRFWTSQQSCEGGWSLPQSSPHHYLHPIYRHSHLGFSQDQINELDKAGEITIVSSAKSITLTIEDVEISSQDIPGWLVANSNGITVALDITISDELRKEGIARELVNRIQNIRKDSGFEVTDKIKVQIQNNEIIEQAVAANESYIKSETLTNELIFVSEINNGTEIEFDELKTIILISK